MLITKNIFLIHLLPCLFNHCEIKPMRGMFCIISISNVTAVDELSSCVSVQMDIIE